MAKTKANEREFQGQVIKWIGKQIEQGGLPFKNAINDPGLYGQPTVKFPDVLVTLDESCKQPFCGWELKTPKTDVRNKELLKDAVKKAQTLGAKYFVTWNMQTATIWRTPEKTRISVQEKDEVREFGPYRQITSVSDIRDAEKTLLLESVCAKLLRDLASLYYDEKTNLPVTDTTFFVDMVGNTSGEMAETLLDDINRAVANKSFNKKLDAWVKKQGINKYDQYYRKTLAQQITYKIIGKILFYMTLRKHRLELPRMELSSKNYKTAIKKMRGLFQHALEVDYQAVFEPDITDEIELSADTVKIITQLTENLAHWSFDLMPLDVIGNVFEKLIPEEARHSLGQYFTPDNLVDLIISFCVRSGDDFVMDPTCGTGTFLIRSYNKLRSLRRKAHHKLLEQVWGFDIAGFPAELATINLYRQDFNDYLNFPRVLSKDFFEVLPGASFGFPPPKKTIKTGERVNVRIPKFDALVGNFPFIRQERIEKAEKGYKDKLEKVLFERWGKQYPALFRDKVRGNNFNGKQKLRLSGQADIYAYLFFHSAAHLKIGGRMGFVTSNSWLDVAYGYELQKFFLSKFKVIAICESRCEPWFEQSAVNTVFTILERSDDKKANENNFVRFVKIKRPLGELFEKDAAIDAQSRWIELEKFVDRIEGVAATGEVWDSSRCRKFPDISEEFVRQPEIISYEDDDIRMRLIRQGDLANEVEAAGQTVKWGQYLRAPDIYFEILEKCADKFVPLAEVADIRRGITTGINEFFYLTEDKIKHWEIERKFLKPVITSTKEIPTIFVDEKKLSQKLFVCDKSKKGLAGTHALKYIRRAERHEKQWLKAPSVQGRKYWYAVPKNEVSDFLILRFRDKRHYTPVNPQNLLVGDTLFVGEFKDKSHSEFGCAFLNSALTALFTEVLGRTNLGDGLLTTYGPEIEMLLLPLKDTAKASRKKTEKVLNAFRRLGKRKVLPFGKEIKRKDRKDFEEAIFECLGLGQAECKAVCEAVNELMEERHLLPKLRSAKKKRRFEQDFEKLCEEVGEEIFPDGVRKFPDAFVKGWPRVKCEEIAVAAAELKLGENFLGKQEICDSQGQHFMDVSSEAKGKFIVYAKRKDEHIIKLPTSEIVVKKAVQNYEIYLKEQKQKLYTAFMEKCSNHNSSENMARQVFEEFGLPDIQI